MSRILLSCYRCDPNGVSEAYAGFRWAEMLSRSHSVILATPSYNVPAIERYLSEEAAPDRIEVLPIPMADVDDHLGRFGSAVKPGFFLYDRKLRRALRARGSDDIDLVWHRTPMSLRHPSGLYRSGIPFIAGPLGGGLSDPEELGSYFSDQGMLFQLKRFDRALFSSRRWMRSLYEAAMILVTCDYVVDLLPESVRPKARVVLDTAVGEDAFLERRPHDGFVVLFVGRLVRYKAPTMAVDAFAHFYSAIGRPEGVKLILVGEGSERGVIEKRLRDDPSLPVELTGNLSRDEVARHYSSADVFLFPSITEASGNVYLEAMAAGIPLIVVDNGGGRSIPDETCAVKVPLGDEETIIEGLASGLRLLYDDAARRKRMGAAGTERVRRHFTWDAISRTVEGLLNGLDDGGATAAREQGPQ